MDKKGVGIITFHTAINYGAVLQAAALENAFRELGIPAEIIDYKNHRFEEQYGLQKQFESSNILKRFVLFAVKNSIFLVKKKKFRDFLKKKTVLSSEKYTYDDVANCEPFYNSFVTGSDQVWNLELTNGDTRYFLDFVPPEKRYSYAASFGRSSLESKELEEYRSLLNEFGKVSLREASAQNILNQIAFPGLYDVHVDPTLLFDGAWWSTFVQRKKKGKYILFYKVASPDELIPYVEMLSDKLGLPVIEISSNLKKSSKKFRIISNAGPEDFVSLIENAEVVATTSFHAAVFSLLFHRKMALELMDKTGKYNVRIDSLLKSAGIDYEREKKITLLNDINWEQVDAQLDIQRKKARDYLKYLI